MAYFVPHTQTIRHLPASRQFRRSHRTRQAMLQMVQILLFYSLVDVIDTLWTKFIEEAKQVCNWGEMTV